MSNEPKFVDGLRVYAPRDGAQDFIIANLVINVRELREFLAQYSNEVRIDIKKSKGGKFYASVNDYKADKPKREPVKGCPQPESDGFENSDIPF